MTQQDRAGTTVRVLGPVSATVAGEPAALSSPTARALLALLACDAGRVVPVDRLIVEIWGEDADPSRLSSVHVYVSRLRRALGDVDGAQDAPVRLRRRPPGYVLELPAGALDAERLARLATAARARVAADPAAALALLDEALALVAGDPLADVIGLLGPWAAAQARRLGELVMSARESHAEALLGVGRAADAAYEAQRLLAVEPLRESVLAVRLLALYRAGRQAEALSEYEAFRHRLADALGVDPGPALRRLHAQLLQQDPALDATPSAPTGPDATRATASVVGGRRAEQIEALDLALARARQGHGSLWLVAGEAGIGKTHLTQQVLARARAAGMSVAVGRAQEVARNAPYWLWSGVLQDLPEMPRTKQVEVLLGEATADPSLTRPALHDAVARLLADRAVAGPLLLVLEDVHWGDEASLQLIARLAELVASAPLLVLCTWRVEDAEPAGAFGALLAHLARTAGTSRLSLTGLAPVEAAVLLAHELGSAPDDETVATATDRTGGNPFFLQELARLVRDAPDPAQAWTQVPGTVRDVLLHRVSGLPEPARRVLDVAAVHGRECDLAQLEAVAGLSGDQLDTALAAAVQSGLVTEISSSSPSLRFRHALVREALEARLGARARMRLHAEAGAALARRADVDADQLAFHLLAGGDLADASSTVQAVIAAVDRAMAQLAAEHAQHLLERAFVVLPRVPEGGERDRLELALQARFGTVVATRYGFAAPVAQAALERCQHLALRVEPSADVLAALYRRLLWLLMSGDYPGVRGFAEVVLTHADGLRSDQAPDRFRLLGHLARGSVLWCLGDAAAAVDELQVALRLADEAGVGHAVSAFGDPTVRVRMFYCHALASAGRTQEAVAVADEMVALAQQSGPADESDALATRGMMYARFGEPGPALRDGVEGRRLSELAGAELLGHFAGVNEGWGRALAGDEHGVQLLRIAAEGYRASGTRMHDPIVFTMLAEAEAATGHPDRAVAAAEAGLASLQRVRSRLWEDRLTAAARSGSAAV